MNEQLDNPEYEFLWKLLANPADPNHSYIFNLQSLVTDFPQSGVLRALLMPNGDKRNLKHSTAYFNPGTLYKLSIAADTLPLVLPEQIVQSDEPSPVPTDVYFTPPVTAEAFVPPVEEQAGDFTETTDDEEYSTAIADQEDAPKAYNAFAEPETVTENEPVQQDHAETGYNSFADHQQADAYQAYDAVEEPQAFHTEHEPVTDTYPAPESITPQEDYNYTTQAPVAEMHTEQQYADHEAAADFAPVEHEDAAPVPIVEQSVLAKEYNDYMTQNDTIATEPVYSYDNSERYFHQDIEDEVYDEIVSIEDIGLEQLAILSKEANQEETETSSAETKNNYFVFEPVVDEATEWPATNAQPTPAVAYLPAPQIALQEGSTHNVSRYNDEKMPYTFMWWLDKTRKDHADIYQPYISNATPAAAPAPAAKPKKKEVVDELQQQYYENLVSISSINELESSPKTAASASPRKEDKIIERFIQDVPQIKHPSGTKLDNENKAKKSSEDKDELVTETLARIYTEQMLYHKAILTYKKLMLKFPEKSLYFASQIEQLENKIN